MPRTAPRGTERPSGQAEARRDFGSEVRWSLRCGHRESRDSPLFDGRRVGPGPLAMAPSSDMGISQPSPSRSQRSWPVAHQRPSRISDLAGQLGGLVERDGLVNEHQP
jgi:hypothetical protein